MSQSRQLSSIFIPYKLYNSDDDNSLIRNGFYSEGFHIEISLDETILDLKKAIAKKTKIPVNVQNILMQLVSSEPNPPHVTVTDNKNLRDYDVKHIFFSIYPTQEQILEDPGVQSFLLKYKQ